MHPYYMARFGFARRLFWFGLGGLGATWWYRHHTEGFMCNRRQQYIKEREEREIAARNTPPSYQSYPSYPSPSPAFSSSSSSNDTPMSYPSPPTWSSAETRSMEVPEQKQQRLRELGNQATDAVSILRLRILTILPWLTATFSSPMLQKLCSIRPSQLSKF